MSVELLLKEFHRISEAPDAIPRLRQFILELAVRGRLVEQDLQEDSCAALIRRIDVERKGREKQGLPVNRRSFSPPEAAPFCIPKNWCWAKLGFLTNVVMGQSPPGSSYNKAGNGVPLINGPVEFSKGPLGLTVLNQYTTSAKKMCRKGDLLLCVRGSTTGRTNVASVDACIGRGVAAIQPLFQDTFVRLFIWSQRDSIIAMGRGAAFPSISSEQIENIAVPVPPFPEQLRIVTTVESSMTLLDDLETSLRKRNDLSRKLLAATLRAALASPEARYEIAVET